MLVIDELLRSNTSSTELSLSFTLYCDCSNLTVIAVMQHDDIMCTLVRTYYVNQSIYYVYSYTVDRVKEATEN